MTMTRPESASTAVRAWLEQPALLGAGLRGRDPQVPVRELGGHPAARRPREKADLDQVRLMDVFHGFRLLGDRGRDRVKADGTALELDDHRFQQLPVQRL